MRLRIKELRSKAGRTQGDVSKALGISQSYFAQIEAGVRPLKSTMQQSIADVLGVEPIEIVDWDAPDEDLEEKALELFRKLDPSDREMWLEFARSLSKRGG